MICYLSSTLTVTVLRLGLQQALALHEYSKIEGEGAMKLQSGHNSVAVSGTELEKQQKDFGGYKNGLVRLLPGRWLFPSRFQDFADKIYNFKFRSSDVVVMTYPKCGTSWTQEIVWTMKHNPDLNHPDAEEMVMARSPYLEADMLGGTLPQSSGEEATKNPLFDAFMKKCPGRNPADGIHIQLSECVSDPRIIKSHMSFSLLNPSLLDTTKVVYVARNPKDVIVSYHHHSRILAFHDYIGNFEDFIQYFLDDDVVYGPYWLHLKEAWEKRNHPNLFIMFYEDMKANPLKEIKRLDTFLGTNLPEAKLENIVKYTSFGEMKTRGDEAFKKSGGRGMKQEVVEKEGGFFRKGQSGDWKGKLTPEQEDKVDQWIHKNLDSIGLFFKYEA